MMNDFTRLVAHHEAAHAAMQMFLGLEPSSIQYVTVVPNSEFLGRVRHEEFLAVRLFQYYPEPLKKITGRALMMFYLAGHAAEDKASGEGYFEVDIHHQEGEMWEEEGFDQFEALNVAKTLERRGWPAHREINLAAKWTLEALNIPLVWEAVQKMASDLEINGKIDGKKVWTHCEEIQNLRFRIPKWRSRFTAKL